MAHVLSCPRCLQSRFVPAIVPGQTCFCPFCRLEFEPRLLPAREQPMRPTPRKRKARRWPLLVAAVLVLPVGAVALLALRGERASESQWKNLRDTAGRDKVYVNARKANKPALV